MHSQCSETAFLLTTPTRVMRTATGNLPPMARPWATAAQRWNTEDITRAKLHFNVPEMQDIPSNFFGPKGGTQSVASSSSLTVKRCPKGPADPAGLARDFRCA